MSANLARLSTVKVAVLPRQSANSSSMLSKQPDAGFGTIPESPLCAVGFGLLPQPVPIQRLCSALLLPLLPSPQRYTFCAGSPAVSPEQHNLRKKIVMSHAWWNQHLIDFAILQAST